MKLKTIFFFSLIILSFKASAQNVSDYEYIIIPERFDFQEHKHQFQLNSLLRVLFQKEGYNVLMNTESKPKKLAKNPCLALNTQVEKLSSMLSSKFQIKLFDCYNKVIFRTKIGESRSKKHKDGYKEGIREAFESIKTLDKRENSSTESQTNKANQIKDDIKTLAYYKKDGEIYRLARQRKGYMIYKADKKVAEVITQSDGSLKFKNPKISGIARFTPEGDLIVTYQDQDINRQVKMTYYKVQE
ncbi:MAG: hypothetical protein RI558_06615 [Psychroflexus sp.]|jgi:hypothetical protein|nr:hypothetical protein [Psychroflexus sp.]MDR9448730.1 hypothetical protein [Psychroflexus sp.]